MKLTVATLFAANALAAFAQGVPTVLTPCRDVTLASRIDSALRPYEAKVGERVRTGQVLVRADDERYAIDYRKAKEQFEFMEATYADKLELHKKDFCSDFELKKAKFDAALAEAAFREAELNLGWCAFKAPFDGKFAEIATKEYDPVKPGQPVLRIIDDSKLFAVANVPMGTVKVGDKVRLAVGGVAAEGRVYEVAPHADSRTGTVRIRVLVENRDGKLMVGMTGTIDG